MKPKAGEALTGAVRDAKESFKKEQEFIEKVYGRTPSKKRIPLFITFADAVEELAGKTKSTVTRARAARLIIKHLKKGDLRLGANGVESLKQLKPSARQNKKRTNSRRWAFLYWKEFPSASVRSVADFICSEHEFSECDPSSVARWIKDMKPQTDAAK